jgi:hypothetical protein
VRELKDVKVRELKDVKVRREGDILIVYTHQPPHFLFFTFPIPPFAFQNQCHYIILIYFFLNIYYNKGSKLKI